jgi:hypothetical protein
LRSNSEDEGRGEAGGSMRSSGFRRGEERRGEERRGEEEGLTPFADQRGKEVRGTRGELRNGREGR